MLRETILSISSNKTLNKDGITNGRIQQGGLS